MKYLLSTILFLASFSLWAQQNETRDLNDFSEISISQGIELVAKKGSRNSIDLEVSRIDLDDVITEVRGDKLYIKLSKGRHRSNRVRATLIYQGQLEEIVVSTAARATFRDKVKSRDLRLSSSTSATLELQVEADNIDMDATTSGRILIEGTSEEIEASATTGAVIDAKDLEGAEAYAKANTGAVLKLNVSDRLRASAGTGGSIRYSGKPRTDIRTNTGGSVKRAW